jgi:hypothetical protein
METLAALARIIQALTTATALFLVDHRAAFRCHQLLSTNNALDHGIRVLKHRVVNFIH